MPDLPGTEVEDRERLKQIQDSVRAVASDLLARGIAPTISRIARVVEGDRLTLLAALETWASNLSGPDRLAMAGGNKRRPNEHLVREATRPMAEAAKQQRGTVHREIADDEGRATGSVTELQHELSRQEAQLERLRQRKLAIEASLETTNTQIRAAEVRARLIAESLENGGKLMDQSSLQAARRKAAEEPG